MGSSFFGEGRGFYFYPITRRTTVGLGLALMFESAHPPIHLLCALQCHLPSLRAHVPHHGGFFRAESFQLTLSEALESSIPLQGIFSHVSPGAYLFSRALWGGILAGLVLWSEETTWALSDQPSPKACVPTQFTGPSCWVWPMANLLKSQAPSSEVW